MQYNSIPIKTSRCDLLLLNVKHVHQLCFALARFLILVPQKTQPILQFRNHGLKQRTKDRYDGFVQLTSVCPSLRLVHFYGPQVVHGKLCLMTLEHVFSLIGFGSRFHGPFRIELNMLDILRPRLLSVTYVKI